MPGSPLMALQRQLLLTSAVVISCGIYIMILKEALLNEPSFFISFIFVAITLLAFYLKMARQKTAYHYRIHQDHATLDHHIYYSDIEIRIIKTLSAICMLVFVGAALITGSLLFLVGPAAIGFLAALRLLNWQNPITHEKSLP
jgi:hypothetical protein